MQVNVTVERNVGFGDAIGEIWVEKNIELIESKEEFLNTILNILGHYQIREIILLKPNAWSATCRIVITITLSTWAQCERRCSAIEFLHICDISQPSQ